MNLDNLSCEAYTKYLLDAYSKTPGTTGFVHKADRKVAYALFEQGVSLKQAENALCLGAARRLFRPNDAPPLQTVRSLAYFLPVIEEVLTTNVGDEYFAHVRRKLAQFTNEASHEVNAVSLTMRR